MTDPPCIAAIGAHAADMGFSAGATLLKHTRQGWKGRHNAWVLWTSDEAAERVYAGFDFRESRRFAALRRALGGWEGRGT